jgi:hypothetical protein
VSAAPWRLPPPPEGAAARRMIEHLRSGVPLPASDPPLQAGRARLAERVDAALDAVEQRGSRALVLQANYGDGKTHAMRLIWHLAARRRFVVSEIALTRETPFDRLDRVYPKLLADTYLPGAEQPGIERLVAGIASGSEQARQLLRFAEDDLHPKLYGVLRNLIDGSSTEATEALLQDLARLDLSLPDLKRIHRSNFREPLRASRFSAQRDARDYFRLIDFLVRLQGLPGWVLLFDEAELIGRLGRGGRARAYANVGRLAGDGLGCRHVLSVFGVASNFYASVLERRRDPQLAPAWLEQRGDTEGAERCRIGMATLQEAMFLDPLSPSEWTDVMNTVLEAHQAAYGWSAGVDAGALWREVQRLAPATDTRLRTRLRLAIQWLDLLWQNGAPPHVQLYDVGDVALDDEDVGGAEAAAGRDAE